MPIHIGARDAGSSPMCTGPSGSIANGCTIGGAALTGVNAPCGVGGRGYCTGAPEGITTGAPDGGPGGGLYTAPGGGPGGYDGGGGPGGNAGFQPAPDGVTAGPSRPSAAMRSASCSIDGMRCWMSLAIAPITSSSIPAGSPRSGRRRDGGSGVSSRCLDRIAITDGPSNGSRPVSISYIIAPSAYTSVRPSTLS